jgi:hypothetical protein
MQQFKDEKLSNFLQKGLEGVPNAPYAEFQRIQNMIEQGESESKFSLDSLWSIFSNKVALATLSVVILAAGSLIHFQNQTKVVTLTTSQYTELLTLDSSSENLKFGEDWL